MALEPSHYAAVDVPRDGDRLAKPAAAREAERFPEVPRDLLFRSDPHVERPRQGDTLGA